ncbi:MAG: DHH family phosphoesterase [Planctomycetes bacterium]|nr:DHH family phosphoesterase [Planctomycetota bacterium]
MSTSLDLIRASERIVVAGHLRADGDSLGAAIVLARGLRAMGKQVELILPDPPDSRYSFLERRTPWSIYSGKGSLPDHDLVIVCDCSQLDRLGAMGTEIEILGSKRLVVDHHPFDRAVHRWDAEYHDVTAAATGLLAVDLLRELGEEPDKIALEAAFVALMTDTGWLKYSNADARAFAAAADLVGRGVDPDSVYRDIYQQTSAGTPRGIGAALASTEYLADGKAVLGWIDGATLRTAQGELVDTDEILDILRAVQSVEVVAFLSERGGRVKVSFRSKTWLDVNQGARQIGGGGHARAAGATFPEGVSIVDAREQLSELLEAAVSAGPPAA